jgi:hypothetical protein
MGVKLAAASGGSIELVPTNTASNFTVTVPAVTGTMLTTATAGTVLQVVNATTSTAVTNASVTYADTGLTASITPTSTTSKILVLVSQNGVYKSTSDTSANFKLLRNSTDLSIFCRYGAASGSTAFIGVASASTNYLDSPATTSSTTYKTQIASDSGTSLAGCQVASAVSTITLMEIAA